MNCGLIQALNKPLRNVQDEAFGEVRGGIPGSPLFVISVPPELDVELSAEVLEAFGEAKRECVE